MNIHEYQAKELLASYGVPTPRGKVARTIEEAVAIAEEMDTWPVVVKAQVHVGGRGKAGGVKLARNADQVRDHASKILGLNIRGSIVRQVLVEQGVDIKREIYLGVIMDRAGKAPLLMASAAGGVDIEEVAAHTPEKILRMHLSPVYGMKPFHVRTLEKFLDIPESALPTFENIVTRLIEVFYAKDCSLAEVNPLVIQGDGTAIACDAKVSLDDNALFKHRDMSALRDDSEEEPLEVRARVKRLSYVKLNGQIGCIVNGAGLAMGTMDIIKHFGGEPANFLDIGGSGKAQQVADALELITSDPAVNTIFFNIFGGILRCDYVAEGILKALEQLPNFSVPIVIRLSGTNEELARQMLEDSRDKFARTTLHVARTMSEGARKAVEISKR